MKRILILFCLLVGPFLNADYMNDAGETASRVVQSLKDTFSEAKSFVSQQYYKQTIKLTMHAQEGDYAFFQHKFSEYPFWKRTVFFYEKWTASSLHDEVMEKGQWCLDELEKEDVDEDILKQNYEEFLELRNSFIAKYETYERT